VRREPSTIASPAPSVIDVSNMPRTVAPGHRGCKAFGPSFPTRVVSAFYHACKRFPGGITEVAKRIEMSGDVLQKKLSPTCDTHNLTVDEAERITLATGDPAGAIELARAARLTCIPMPRADEGSLHKGMSDIAKEFSDLLNEFSQATTDNRISENECARFERESIELFVACSHELQRMRAMAASREPVIPEPRKKFAQTAPPTADPYVENRGAST